MLNRDPFGEFALLLARLGLCPLPCGGKDGKRPLIKHAHWLSPPSEHAIARLAQQHCRANVGVLTGLSRIVVVDIDTEDLSLIRQIQHRFGPTPIQIRTGSGGQSLSFDATGCHQRERLHFAFRRSIWSTCYPPSQWRFRHRHFFISTASTRTTRTWR